MFILLLFCRRSNPVHFPLVYFFTLSFSKELLLSSDNNYAEASSQTLSEVPHFGKERGKVSQEGLHAWGGGEGEERKTNREGKWQESKNEKECKRNIIKDKTGGNYDFFG